MNRLLTILLFLLPLTLLGNNVRIVGTVKTPAGGVDGSIGSIVFTLEWENSWRDDYNHDAVYVSLRYKLLKQGSVWYPVYLENSGHTTDNGFLWTMSAGQTANRNIGVFIYPGTMRSGIARTTVTLKWNLSTTNSNGPGKLESSDLVMGNVILACTGIEMVYIPRGSFALGDHANGTGSPMSFCQRDTCIPAAYDLIDTMYLFETNPNNIKSNPPQLAANRINDISPSTNNAWVGNQENTQFWTIDFGRRSDGTLLPDNRYTIRYIGLESIPGRTPKKWTLLGAKEDVQGDWKVLHIGTGADWGTTLERVYPPRKAIRLTSPGDYRYYRIVVERSDMQTSGQTPVLKSVSMTDRELSQTLDYTFIIDTTTTRLGGPYGLSALDGDPWSTGTLPSTYPNGYNAFYVMKYGISQDQYCGFLQMIGPADQKSRTIGANLSHIQSKEYIFGNSRTSASWRNGIVVSTRTATGDTASFACDLNHDDPVSLDGDGQGIGCNYLTPSDMLTYASWLGLRPLTELEYERLSRPPYPYTPHPKECAWNSADAEAPGNLQESGRASENLSSGNANYGDRLNGPVRVGAFASAGGLQKPSGSGFWGVQDLSGNLNEIYYNMSASGRKYNANRHGDGILATLATLQTWGWESSAASFGLRGGSFRSPQPSDLSVSNRKLMRSITDRDFRDSTVTFRLGRSCTEGPQLSSILILADGRSTTISSLTDTVCDGSDYRITGNEPGGNFSVSYLWYKSENLGRTWELLRGAAGRDLDIHGLQNSGMSNNQVREYWFRRRVIRDNSDGLSHIVKLVVIDPHYTVSRFRDTLDGYGSASGIHISTKYPASYSWIYLDGGKQLSPENSGDGLSSYYLPRREDFTPDTSHAMHGKKLVQVTLNFRHACERSEVIGIDVINRLDKDLMKVKNYGDYRAWADGTYAPSAEGYRRPGGGYEYKGDIGSGIYRIDPDGRSGPIAPFDVYCDMTADGGGWTLIVAQYEQDPVRNWNEGIQPDYDPTLVTKRSFALNTSHIPPHNYTAFGKDLDPTHVGYSQYKYTTGNLGLKTLLNIKENVNYQIHRNTGGYYSGHNPESTYYAGSDPWNNTLTYDKVKGGYSWAFSPGHGTVTYRGYAMKDVHTGYLLDDWAWTVWVK